MKHGKTMTAMSVDPDLRAAIIGGYLTTDESKLVLELLDKVPRPHAPEDLEPIEKIAHDVLELRSDVRTLDLSDLDHDGMADTIVCPLCDGDGEVEASTLGTVTGLAGCQFFGVGYDLDALRSYGRYVMSNASELAREVLRLHGIISEHDPA